MKAAVFKDVGVLSIEDRPKPAVRGPDDVLLRVRACGICGSDLHILHVPPRHPATPDTILGHEFIGDVAEVGSAVTAVKPGDRVAVRPILTCGTCRECLSGRPNLCETMTCLGIWLDGGLAEYAVVPATACIPISSSLPLHIAALTEPVACVMNACRKAALVPGDDVVIFGAGAIGLIFVAILRAAGARRVIVVEPTAMRADVALKMGASDVVDPTATDPVEAIGALLPRGSQIVIDAVGTELGHAVSVAAKAGRIVAFGQNEAADVMVHQVDVTKKDLTIIGNFVGQLVFPQAIGLLESGALDLALVVSHTGSLDDLPALIEASRSGEVVKAIILP